MACAKVESWNNDKSKQKKFLPIKRNNMVSLCCQKLPFYRTIKLFVNDSIRHDMFGIHIPSVYIVQIWGNGFISSFCLFCLIAKPFPKATMDMARSIQTYVYALAAHVWAHQCTRVTPYAYTNQSLFHY